mgnify:CR=1 FL=1
MIGKKENLKSDFYLSLILNNYKPTLMIDYERIAYVDETIELRITIDKNIKTTSNCKCFFDELEVPADERFILEVKYLNELPEEVEKILNMIELKEIKISKFKMYN